jgi:transcription factor E
MQKKFLKDALEIVSGKQSEELVELLDGKKYVNEFIIAKKLNLTINQTRNILYKVSDYGLVSSIRKKDKRKGWYTYFWKIEVQKCLEFIRNNLLKKMEQINHQLKSRQTKEFYICERCGIEFTEENALLHDFMCNECGEVMSRKDNSSMIREYNKGLEKLRRDLNEIDEEIKVEKEKTEKVKTRAANKEEKKKKEAKAKIRSERLSAKKKSSAKKPAKKAVKKVVRKKKKK